MDNSNYLIVITFGLRESFLTRKEIWTDLFLLCQAHKEFEYSQVKQMTFPYEYQGWLFERLPVNKKIIC